MILKKAEELKIKMKYRSIFKFIKSPDPTLTVYDDLYHEIWFELNKEPVLNELNHFLTQITHEQKT